MNAQWHKDNAEECANRALALEERDDIEDNVRERRIEFWENMMLWHQERAQIWEKADGEA